MFHACFHGKISFRINLFLLPIFPPNKTGGKNTAIEWDDAMVEK
jgi:hypothetical protein